MSKRKSKYIKNKQKRLSEERIDKVRELKKPFCAFRESLIEEIRAFMKPSLSGRKMLFHYECHPFHSFTTLGKGLKDHFAIYIDDGNEELASLLRRKLREISEASTKDRIVEGNAVFRKEISDKVYGKISITFLYERQKEEDE